MKNKKIFCKLGTSKSRARPGGGGGGAGTQGDGLLWGFFINISIKSQLEARDETWI